MIHNLQELADTIGCEAGSIGKRLYRDTECGITFDVTDTGVTVCGFAEGSEGECQPIPLDYPFEPFTFWDAVADADGEGCDAWHEANGCLDSDGGFY